MSYEQAKNLLIEKSFLFAVRMVRLFKHLSGKKKEFVLSKQLLQSRTSINAENKIGFIHKLSITQKEVDETRYWLELFVSTAILSDKEYKSFSKDADELIKLLRSTIITSKQNLKSGKVHSS